MRTVLVTGGYGFIGSHVIERLVKMGHLVISIDPRRKGCIVMNSARVEYIRNTTQNVSMDRLLIHDAVDHIIHLGAWSNVRESMTEPALLYSMNTMATAHILDGIIRAEDKSKVKSIVFASSSSVEAPESHYGVSKAASEMMLDVFRIQMEDKISVSNLRFANVYGPRQNPQNGTLIARFVDTIFTGNSDSTDPPQIYGDGKQERDYIFVSDVVDAIMLCMEHEPNGMEMGLNDTMNVSTGLSHSVNEVCRYIKDAANLLNIDMKAPEYINAKPGDKRIVKMAPGEPLRHDGWTWKTSMEEGILHQIKWQLNMQLSWDQDHYTDGRVVK